MNEAQYFQQFIPEKKLDAKTTRMATVIVTRIKGRKATEIGSYSFTRAPKSESDQQVADMVYELIREYEMRHIRWPKLRAKERS